MISKHWVSLLLPVFGGVSVSAQKDSTVKQLDQVVVTATKYPVKQSQTGKVVIIIPHEEIEKSTGKPLGELLGEQAGITVNGSLNDAGTNQSISIRGAGSGRTLVLVDGVPVNDPSENDNSFDLNLIPVTMIERIEISKGAQSTLYGSDAIAGVINIITVKPDIRSPFGVKASASGGNYGTYNGNAQVYGKLADRLTYNIRYNHDHTTGFPAAHDSSHTASDVPFTNDGYHGDMVAGNLAWNPITALTVKGFLQYSGYTTDIDAAAFTPAVDYTSANKSLMAGGGFSYKLPATTITANYRYSTTNRRLLEDSVYGQSYFTDQYFGKSQFLEIFASTNLGYGLTLLSGADYRFSSMNENGSFGGYPLAFKDTSVSATSMYGSLLYSGPSGLSVELGGRLNTDSRYGSNYTYTFNPAWLIARNWKLYGSIASAFKAPTLYQLYSSYGDPDLQPEKSSSYEAGVQFDNNVVNLRTTWFHRKTRDGIDYNYFTNLYYNYDEEKGNGIEWEGTVKFARIWSLTANYTWLKMQEQTQSHVSYVDTSYHYALRVPGHTVNVKLGIRPVHALFVSLSGHYESKRYDIGGYDVNFNPLPDVALDPFVILNGYAEFRPAHWLKLFAEGRNILNKKFYTIYGYNSIPAMFTAGATVEF
ncbi:MAG TPA: TonB-dependent receptor [Puia sp.]|jgi:vitamin B12 transporter|nr:TonB-dependent receptor [Puia sp.]